MCVWWAAWEERYRSRDCMYVVWTHNGVPAPDLDFRPLSWCPLCEKVVQGYQSWSPHQIVFGSERRAAIVSSAGC